MRHRAIVLGCGMVGAAMARDLAGDPRFEVTVADLRGDNLDRVASEPNLKTLQTDLGGPDRVREAVRDFDLVLGAMPSALGFSTLQAVIESGKPYADISFMAEDAAELDAMAQERGVTAVVDCGVAPGLANMIIGHCHAALDRTDNVIFYVGGLPKRRTWPYQYKAPFAPWDVLEVYTRPAHVVVSGEVVVKPALSEAELIDLPRVGRLEAFITDGLRSLVRTIDAPNMQEKTLRYPGHVELIRVLRETGFFEKEPIDVGGVRVRPRDVTAKLLFPKWALEPGEAEFTVLRVVVEGEKDGRCQRHVYDLHDEYDAETQTTSMARTTGFPCAIVARWLVDGTFSRPGVFPPELLARDPGMLARMMAELAARAVHIEHAAESVD